jgi:hypothetical protein
MEYHSVNRLLFAKYPLHLLVADIEVGVVVWERPNRLRKIPVCTPEIH